MIYVTLEELNTLPISSTVLDARQLAWQKQIWLFGEIKWMQAGDDRPADDNYSPLPPLTLLWRPISG